MYPANYAWVPYLSMQDDASVDWSGVSRTIVDKWKEITLDSNAALGTELLAWVVAITSPLW